MKFRTPHDVDIEADCSINFTSHSFTTSAKTKIHTPDQPAFPARPFPGSACRGGEMRPVRPNSSSLEADPGCTNRRLWRKVCELLCP